MRRYFAIAITFIICFTAGVRVSAETITFSVPAMGDKTFQATLDLPTGRTPAPVVVMLPGTDGVDQRQDFHRKSLLAAGIGTFVIDTKTGHFTSRRNRPSATTMVPVGFEALRLLRGRHDVDAGKIAVMGWSFGGTISLRLAHVGNAPDWLNGKPGFAAHVGLYGGCTSRRSVYLQKVPILILIGTQDTHTDPDRCKTFEHLFSNVTVVTYPGAHHGFDKEGVNRERKGRIMRWNEDAALDARTRVTAFFTKVFQHSGGSK